MNSKLKIVELIKSIRKPMPKPTFKFISKKLYKRKQREQT